MLLSRVADSLYWISRYLERAEHTARLVGVRLDLGLDRRPNSDGWEFSRIYEGLRLKMASEMPASATALVDAVVLDLANRESVAAYVTSARENAQQVREEISSEMWEQVNGLFLRMKQVRMDGTWGARPHYLSKLIIEGIHLFEGVTDATMGHGEGWHYLQAGRFLERAEATAALLDLHLRDRSTPAEWVGLLRSCCSLEAYCRHYTADIRPERIAEFLLLNADCPRSVRFAAARVETSLRAIGQLSGRAAGGAERLSGRLHATLDYGQVDEILSDDPHTYLDGIGHHCRQIHQSIYQSFIAYPIESALPA
ncbi:MAG TPA: alpha-E domain-containing protein [Vicinamibacterales bacterium]|nr:alpha-E domain-containing protein [Vicinamibacterales bacterium]